MSQTDTELSGGVVDRLRRRDLAVNGALSLDMPAMILACNPAPQNNASSVDPDVYSFPVPCHQVMYPSFLKGHTRLPIVIIIIATPRPHISN